MTSGRSFPSQLLISISSTESSYTVKEGYFLISICMLLRYWSLSICALKPYSHILIIAAAFKWLKILRMTHTHTAGPFLLFNTLKWIPDISETQVHHKKNFTTSLTNRSTALPHTLPHSPSRASISLIKCPLPMPPNEGLQDISPENKKISSTNSWKL